MRDNRKPGGENEEDIETTTGTSKTPDGTGGGGPARTPPAAVLKGRAKPSPLVSALSGAISGSLISGCVQPLDVVRTKMQADAAQGVVRSTAQTLLLVVRENGLRGLWQGPAPSVIRVGLGAGMHFVLLESVRSALLVAQGVQGGSTQQLEPLNAVLSGGVSRAIAAAVLCPITVVKTRMEYVVSGPAGASVHRYRNTLDALATIARQEGVRGWFRGLAPTILTNAPFSGLYYMFYTQFKDMLAPDVLGAPLPQPLINFSSGCVAAVMATVLTQPADVIRTRIQLDLAGGGAVAAAAQGARRHRGTLGAMAVLAQILKTEGPGALLAGTTPRILKRTSQTALVWTMYEELVPRITAAALWAASLASKVGADAAPAASAGAAESGPPNPTHADSAPASGSARRPRST